MKIEVSANGVANQWRNEMAYVAIIANGGNGNGEISANQ